jgi:4-hydroxy-tetrahydrodipicolinate reductase
MSATSGPSPVRCALNGARGRMGSRIIELAQHDPRISIVRTCDHDDAHQLAALGRGSVDVVIDFSSPTGAEHAARAAQSIGCALLVGTTGLSANFLDLIGVLSRSVAVLIAPNTSLGVAVLNRLAALAAELLGPAYTIDLIEAHHSAKKDAPSGTALRLLETLQRASGSAVPPEHIHCIRAGDIIGDHTIQFAGPGERITLGHSATTRDVFARGAIRAALWLSHQPPGQYGIEDSLTSVAAG